MWFSALRVILYPTKFNAHPSSGNRVVPCGQTDTTMLTICFCNYAKTPNKMNKMFAICRCCTAIWIIFMHLKLGVPGPEEG